MRSGLATAERNQTAPPLPRLPAAQQGSQRLTWLCILAESLNWHVFYIPIGRLQQKRR